MKRSAILSIVVAVTTIAAFAANAAIITLAGPSTATRGEVIFLTATGSTGVGPADEGGISVIGNILYQTAFVDPNVAGSSQNAVVPGWTNGVLDCTTARCRGFNQIAPVGTTPFVPALSDFLVSSTSFIIDPATPLGTVVTFSWQTSPFSGSVLFFGAVSGPGIVTVTIVPEPTTAALLCVGLVGLVTGRRTQQRPG